MLRLITFCMLIGLASALWAAAEAPMLVLYGNEPMAPLRQVAGWRGAKMVCENRAYHIQFQGKFVSGPLQSLVGPVPAHTKAPAPRLLIPEQHNGVIYVSREFLATELDTITAWDAARRELIVVNPDNGEGNVFRAGETFTIAPYSRPLSTRVRKVAPAPWDPMQFTTLLDEHPAVVAQCGAALLARATARQDATALRILREHGVPAK